MVNAVHSAKKIKIYLINYLLNPPTFNIAPTQLSLVA